MRVLLLNQYFHPDVAPTAQLASDLGEALARRGHEVCAVASNRPYAVGAAGERTWLPLHEWQRGVEIVRVPSTAWGRRSHWLRAIDYATYFAGAALPVLARVRPDVVVALSTPPLLAALGLLARELRHARLALWVMDVYPDLAVELGALAAGGVAARLLGRLSRAALSRADAVVALDEAMRDRLVASGAPASRVAVIDNWCDVAIHPAPRSQNALRRALHLDDEVFVVSYSGNFGHGHDFDTVVDAMALLAREAVHWLYIGDGPRRDGLARAVAARGLAPRATFLPYQPAASLPVSLTAADASLVTLGERLAGLLVPSKLYGILAAGVPVLYVGPPAGRAHDVAGAARAGVSIRNGDAPGLARAIRRLRDHADERAVLGLRGRALHEERYARAGALDRHHALLAALVHPLRNASAASAVEAARPSAC